MALPKRSAASSRSSAYDLILEAIDGGALRPGARLVESELAERFGVSRTPVREALRRLEAQGLAVHRPHRGVTVAELDYSELAEFYTFREIFEGSAARLAATSATPAEVELLAEMAGQDRAALGRPEELARRNRRFHQQIHLAAHNRYLNDALEKLRLGLALLSGTTLAVEGRARQSLDEHDAIVAAIVAHDPDRAEALARQHIRNAYKTRLRLRGERGGG